jgi:hypothetical protein
VARKKTVKRAGKKPARKKPRPRRALKARVTAAAAEPCVDRPEAEDTVFGCAGGDIDVETKLGDLFPNPTEREKFCRCVANRSGVPRRAIPCSSGTTIEAVIEAITC